MIRRSSAGQGTIGLEILDQVPDVEAIVVPIGGGGLAAGVALAVKSMAPTCKIFGVEPERAAGFVRVAGGRPSAKFDVRADHRRRTGRVPRWATWLSKSPATRLDGVVTVSEEELALAMLRLGGIGKERRRGGRRRPAGRLHDRQAAGISRAADRDGAFRRQCRSIDSDARDRESSGGRRPALPLYRRCDRSTGRPGTA